MNLNIKTRNKMKTNFKSLAFLAFLGILLFSCSDDDNPLTNAPIISDFEYGEGNDHSTDQFAYKGSELHMEAVIYAEATVKEIKVDIHAHDLTPAEGEVEWDFEKTYTDTNYQVINATFHEHIDIPSNIPSGEYHVTLTVVDELGNSTEIEDHIQILDPIGLSDISIDSSVQRGTDMHAEFEIFAVHSIHNVTVDIHAHDLPIATGELEWNFEQTYEEGIYGLTEAEFHQHIDVPVTAPAGKYHAVFTVEDEKGNTFDHHAHIDVTK